MRPKKSVLSLVITSRSHQHHDVVILIDRVPTSVHLDPMSRRVVFKGTPTEALDALKKCRVTHEIFHCC